MLSKKQRQTILNSVRIEKPRSNRFDLSNTHKFSCNFGTIVPMCIREVIPGDKFVVGCEAMVRLAPTLAPVMHRMTAEVKYFFVPNRLLWYNWENWITNTKVDGVIPAFPTVSMNSTSYGLLADYLGIPTPLGMESEVVSAMPFAAYQLIWNEYFRDQNLQADIWPSLGGPLGGLGNGDMTDFTELYAIRNRAWEHDYYTAALPFAQKGPAVDLPLGTFNDVPIRYSGSGGVDAIWQNEQPVGTETTVEAGDSLEFPDNTMYAETSALEGASVTINALRNAYSLQRFLEKQARGGTRYTEQIRAQFGVVGSDARLQRPEFIGGYKKPIVISEVLNTTGTDDAPQGNMAGHGVGYMRSGGNYYNAEEHGYIIGVLTVMPDTAYQQGIDRHWLKYQDYTQFFWSDFAHLGETPVLNKELYAFQGESGNGVFGYQPNYLEYRFIPNKVSADFKSTLNYWHMGRIFASAPALNEDFIKMQSSEVDRIFAVEDPDAQKLWVQCVNEISAERLMPVWGEPGW